MQPRETCYAKYYYRFRCRKDDPSEAPESGDSFRQPAAKNRTYLDIPDVYVWENNRFVSTVANSEYLPRSDYIKRGGNMELMLLLARPSLPYRLFILFSRDYDWLSQLPAVLEGLWLKTRNPAPALSPISSGSKILPPPWMGVSGLVKAYQFGNELSGFSSSPAVSPPY